MSRLEDKLDEWDMSELVARILGSIEPSGSQTIDDERKKTITYYEILIVNFLSRLVDTSRYKNDPRDSVAKMGKEAQRAIEEIVKVIKNNDWDKLE